MILWLQKFNIRPKEERGMLWAGRLLTVAVIPIYFLALVGVVRNKRVTSKTTPKGDAGDQEEDPLRVFAPHLILSLIILAGMGAAFLLGHTTWVFLAWGCVTASLMAAFTIGQLCRRALSALRWKKVINRAG